jgi:hypothetical protein
MVYDPVLDRLILFGTRAGGDTWVLDRSSSSMWQRLATTGEPPPQRSDHTATYDPVRRQVLIYGGNGSSGGSPQPLSDVWALDLTQDPPHWLSITPSGTAPPGRYGHTTLYDPSADRMIVFAGDGNDVWELSLSGSPSWNELHPTGGTPPARSHHSAVYDSFRTRMLVFGGSPTFGASLNDVWALSLTGPPEWIELSPDGTPPTARRKHSAFYDSASDRMLVLGGEYVDPILQLADDAWALSLSGSPQWNFAFSFNRSAHAGAYDPSRNQFVVNGGQVINGSFLGYGNVRTTIAVDPDGTQHDLAPVGCTAEELQGGHAAVWDPIGRRAISFGGDVIGCVDPCVTGGHVVILPDTTASRWGCESFTGSPPEARAWPSAVYDPVLRRMLVFGGDSYYGFAHAHDDVVALGLTPPEQWSPLTPTGSPPAPRSRHSAIYDPVGHRMLIFGGTPDSFVPITRWNDVFELTLDGTPHWQQMVPTGEPPTPRTDHVAIYDPYGAVGDGTLPRMIVVGGRDDQGVLDDVWSLSLGGTPEWTKLMPSGTPPSTGIQFAFYDLVQRRLIVWSDDGLLQLSLGATPQWSPLEAEGPGPTPSGNIAVFDPVENRAIVFGASAWALELGAPGVAVDPADAAHRISLAGARPNPARGELTVAFTLPEAGPARLELFDLSGRRLAAREMNGLGPGTHQIRFSETRRLPPGAYLLRLSAAGESVRTKAILIR